MFPLFFFFADPPTTEIYTLSLHDALPISPPNRRRAPTDASSSCARARGSSTSRLWAESGRSEEHTSELQSLRHLVCRLLLEKKKQKDMPAQHSTQHQHNRASLAQTAQPAA